MEIKYQQVSSDLQDFSQYSSLCLSSSSDFQLFQPPYQAFRTVLRAPIRISITVILMFHSCLGSLARSKYFYIFSFSLIIIIIIIIIYSFRVFHISVNWWIFAGVWVTASLLKPPGLVSGFWPFLTMLPFRWFLPVRQLPSPPSLLIIL